MAFRSSRRRSHKDPAQATRAEVEAIALRTLQRRDHTVVGLRRKLEQRKLPTEHIEHALQRVVEWGYVDDERLAPRRVISLQRKSYGPLRVRMKMRDEGFDEDLIEHQLNAIEDSVWLDLARDRLHRKFGTPDTLDRDTRQRAARHLQSRGFPSGMVFRVLDER